MRTAYAKGKPQTKLSFYTGMYSRPKVDYRCSWEKGTIPLTGGVSISHARKIKKFDLVFSAEYAHDDGYVNYCPNDSAAALKSAEYKSVSATAYSDAASVYIQQAQSYNDSAMVMVVAEDNISQKTYTIHFNRELSPIATLSSLGYTLNYADSAVSAFQSDWYDYTVIIAEEETHIPILYYQLSDNRSRAYMLRTPVTVNDTAKIVVVAENGMDAYEIYQHNTNSHRIVCYIFAYI